MLMDYDNIEPKDNKNSNDHPSKDIKASLGTGLLNKRIVICVTASVACYKSIDLIRMLIRHGAEVCVVISKSVEKDRKSTRLNSSHANISYAVFCLKKKNTSYTQSH